MTDITETIPSQSAHSADTINDNDDTLLIHQDIAIEENLLYAGVEIYFETPPVEAAAKEKPQDPDDSTSKSKTPVDIPALYGDDMFYSILTENENFVQNLSNSPFVRNAVSSQDSFTPSQTDTVLSEFVSAPTALTTKALTALGGMDNIKAAGPLGFSNTAYKIHTTSKIPQGLATETVAPIVKGGTKNTPPWFKDLFPDAPQESASFYATHQNPTPTANGIYGLNTLISGTTLFALDPNDTNNGLSNSGAIHMYDMVTGDLIRTIENPNPNTNAKFGYTNGYGAEQVRLVEDKLIVSVPTDTNNGFSNSGVIYIYDANTGDLLSTVQNPDPGANERFGQAEYYNSHFEIQDNTVLVSVYRDNNNGFNQSGAIYMFDLQTGALLQHFENPTPAAYGNFGQYTTHNEDYFVVSNYTQNVGGFNKAGAVYIFDVETGNLVHTLLNPYPGTNDYFGQSRLTIDNDTLIVWAANSGSGFTSSGELYFYDLQSGNLLTRFVNPSPRNYESFSYVGTFGDTVIAVSSTDRNSGFDGSGALFLYDKNTGNLIRTIANPTPATNDYFGWEIVVTGNNIMFVSANYDDNGGFSDSGAIYMYDIATGTLLKTITNPTPETGEIFGDNMVLMGNTLVVSSPYDTNNGHTNSGSIYLYDATTGDLIRAIENPTPGDSEIFGEYTQEIDGLLFISNAYDTNGGYTNSGTLYAYDLTTGNLVYSIENPTPNTNEGFSSDFYKEGDTLIVNHPFDDDTYGAVYLYEFATGDLIATVSNPNIDIDTGFNNFGRLSQVIGDTLIVNAPGDTNGGQTNSGAIYSFLYDFNGDGRVDGTALDDVIYGSPAQNLLTGGDGADTFVFQSATVFNAADIITDFDATEGDILDFRDVLSGYDSMSDDIHDFVRLVSGNGGMQLQIDTDGSANGENFQTAVHLYGNTTLDLDSLIIDGNLLVE